MYPDTNGGGESNRGMSTLQNTKPTVSYGYVFYLCIWLDVTSTAYDLQDP